jgi:hypothetical protein
VLDRLQQLKLDMQVCEWLWTGAASDAASFSFAFHDERRERQSKPVM